MFLIDTHTHIEGENYDQDRDEVISRAKEAGIDLIFNASFDLESSKKAWKLAKANDSMYCYIGYHPCDSAGYNDEVEQTFINIIEEDKKDKHKIRALGEIGLDYHYDDTDKTKQHEVFEAQIDLARKLNLPIVIHSRDADQDTFDMLKNNKAFELGVLMHCYGSSLEMAKRYIEHGVLLGIGGVLTFKNARKLLEVAEYIPLEYLVFETDAPYLTPSPYRGKRNEPSYLRYTAEKLAELKNVSIEEVAKITTENALNFFNLK